MTPRPTSKPVLTAHWDADLYPSNARPITEELVLHILQHGEVLIKDVDLLHNPTIRTALAEQGVRTQFRSLLETGRIKVLLPPRSTPFNIDPTEHPLTAMAQERDNKRPHKFRIWRFTEPYRRYCKKIDPILRETGAIRFRAEYPTTNTFASTLHKTLNEESWRHRDEFRGIDKFADRFKGYCESPTLALRDLHDDHIKPLANDFYRTVAYQCVRLPRFGNSWQTQRRFRRLLQSVYAYCEAQREGADSTYFGEQLTELPMPVNDTSTIDLLSLGVKALDLRITIPVAANIGTIIDAVIRECPSITDVWALSAQEQRPPSAALEEACANIAEAFVKHSMTARPVEWSPTWEQRWRYVRIVHSVLFLISLMGTHGVALVQDHEGLVRGAEGVAVFTKEIMDLIRTGQAQADIESERATVRNVLFHILRSGSV
jgi:hypothetical protein